MIWSRRLVLSLVCLSVLGGLTTLGPGQPASTAAQGLGSKIWVGRAPEIEEYLKTAECVSMEALSSTSSFLTRCTFRPGGLVSRMAWKPLSPGLYRGFWMSYKTEIAAYELDKLLKMDMVPPSVERELQGHKGVAVLWVEDIFDLKAGTSPGESSRPDWEKQLARTTMFDNLIANQARNLGNLLRDQAWNLILIDHTRAFGSSSQLLHQLTRIDSDYWGRVQGLTRQQLDARLGPWLDENQITAILDRRERIRTEINRLVAERGAAAVLLR